MQFISIMLPQLICIDMPQSIMRFIMSQHIFSMSMLMPALGIIMQLMPLADISHFIIGIIGMPQHIIIGMPLQVMVQGMPQLII